MTRRIYDITLLITPDLPAWPGDPPVELTRLEDVAGGAEANVSRLAMSAHTGTHVDAPVHFVPGGAGVEALDLDVLTGPALVVHLPDADAINAPLLESLKLPAGAQRLLFRTRNSELWAPGETAFQRDFVAITADGAHWLAERGVQLVGVDYLSVAPFDDTNPTHQILLRAGVIMVEGLNLHGVEPGAYDLYCLPLKLVGSDGAPARAILVG